MKVRESKILMATQVVNVRVNTPRLMSDITKSRLIFYSNCLLTNLHEAAGRKAAMESGWVLHVRLIVPLTSSHVFLVLHATFCSTCVTMSVFDTCWLVHRLKLTMFSYLSNEVIWELHSLCIGNNLKNFQPQSSNL